MINSVFEKLEKQLIAIISEIKPSSLNDLMKVNCNGITRWPIVVGYGDEQIWLETKYGSPKCLQSIVFKSSGETSVLATAHGSITSEETAFFRRVANAWHLLWEKLEQEKLQALIEERSKKAAKAAQFLDLVLEEKNKGKDRQMYTHDG